MMAKPKTIVIQCRYKDTGAMSPCDNGVMHYFGDQPMPSYDGTCPNCKGTGKEEISLARVEKEIESSTSLVEAFTEELNYWKDLESRFK